MDDLISRLSELRCHYNCFDENERDAYHTLSEAIKALSDGPDTNVGDTISRQAAIDALWKALYAYEDKMEKQFQESDELDVSEWIEHRIFVQNMSDIDRQTILALPSAQQRWVPCDMGEPDEDMECWITVKTTDALYRGNFTKRYGERRDKGFITSGGFMWWNTALAWMPIYEPEPYKGEEK